MSARKAAVKRAPAKARRSTNTVILEVGHAKGAAHGKRLATAAKDFLDRLNLTDCELSLSVVTDRTIRRLNRTWREKDKPTDVLSFPGGEQVPGAPGPRLIGDVVISLDTAVRQAKGYERPLTEELRRYLAHGLLHLLGHDHERPKEAKVMAALEEELLGGEGMIFAAHPELKRSRTKRSAHGRRTRRVVAESGQSG